MSSKAMMVKNRNVNYCGEPGNSVSATVVTLYRALTISNTFSKRPHKPHNTSKNVEHIDQEPFCVKYWNKNNDGLDRQIFVKFAKVHQQHFSALWHNWICSLFLSSIKPEFFEVKILCDFSVRLFFTWYGMKICRIVIKVSPLVGKSRGLCISSGEK